MLYDCNYQIDFRQSDCTVTDLLYSSSTDKNFLHVLNHFHCLSPNECSILCCSLLHMVGQRAATSRRMRRLHPCPILWSSWLKARLAKMNGEGITEMVGWSPILSKNSCYSSNSYWRIPISLHLNLDFGTIASSANAYTVECRWRPRWTSKILQFF